MARGALVIGINAAGLIAAGLAVSAPALALPPATTPGGPVSEVARSVEPVQYRDRSLFRAGDFDRGGLGGPRSLFRPYRYKFGPHYQPPSVIYEPPAVTYRPPGIADRIRCAPRTRAWYNSCAARYRSFDPNKGTYTTYAGQQRFCRCP
jgi:hypothetical protein